MARFIPAAVKSLTMNSLALMWAQSNNGMHPTAKSVAFMREAML